MSNAVNIPSSNIKQIFRIGSVSYLNAKPLIYGLDEVDDLQLLLDVPSRLIDGLREDRFDVALLPVIDYQRLPGLKVLCAGGIASDGPTLTVRIFSRVPIAQITTLACDADSHTSVALARVILIESFGLHPEFVALDHDPAHRHAAHEAEARLLIGDKVICEEPVGFDHQLDLGEAWKNLTGLPFVFAAWMVRNDLNLGNLSLRLQAAKEQGMAHINQIVARHAVPRGWPEKLAFQYMTDNLKYDIGPRQLDAIRLFHQFAAKHGIIPNPPRDLVFDSLAT